MRWVRKCFDDVALGILRGLPYNFSCSFFQAGGLNALAAADNFRALEWMKMWSCCDYANGTSNGNSTAAGRYNRHTN